MLKKNLQEEVHVEWKFEIYVKFMWKFDLQYKCHSNQFTFKVSFSGVCPRKKVDSKRGTTGWSISRYIFVAIILFYCFEKAYYSEFYIYEMFL